MTFVSALDLLCALVCAIVMYARFAAGQIVTVKLAKYSKITKLLSPDVSLADQLQRRALANVRLKTAFNIDSTFVNDDVAAHTAFIR